VFSCSKIEQKQLNTWVSFQSAEQPLLGQFSVSGNTQTQPAASERVMGVLDAINAKWGRNTLRPGRVTTAPDWGMRREMMSQSFTTRLDQLWVVRCN